MTKEIRLILLSVLKNRCDSEEKELENLFFENLDWSYILGELIRHRLNGYFLTFINNQQKKYLFYKALQAFEILSEHYKRHNATCLAYLEDLFSIFNRSEICIAGLKGVIFNTSIYDLTVRKSNDIDILIDEKQLAEFDYIMRQEGFIQSSDNGVTEASKKEKVIQIMNYHDLIPYYKRLNETCILKIDVNFQFDSKDNPITEQILSYGTKKYSRNGFSIIGLNKYTHLCHLAVHFYREASNSLWTDNIRDLDIYKIVDIENTFRELSDSDIREWIKVVKEFGFDKQCYFMVYYLNKFYQSSRYDYILREIRPSEVSYLKKIHIGTSGKTVLRDKDFFTSSFDMIYRTSITEEGEIIKVFREM